MNDVLVPAQKELLACLEIGKILTSTFDREEIFKNILLKGSELIKANNWSLLLLDEVTGELRFEIAVGIEKEVVKGIKIKKGEGVASFVAETGKALFLEDVSESSLFSDRIDNHTGFVTESIICIPLKSHDKILGVLEIINVQDKSIFEEKTNPILTIMADYIAIAINNSKIYESLHRLSITEEYTGLYNSRQLHLVLDKYVTDPETKFFSVVFMDIDNFKSVVDRCGHLLGSKILSEVGFIINHSLEKGDTLFKYGGDEYVIVMKDRDKKSALKMLERIIENLRKATFLKDEGQNIKLTASFGIASYPEDGKSKNEILVRSDENMYMIKRTSKDGIFS